MIEIFIPTVLKLWNWDKLDINYISKNFINILNNDIIDINLSWFESIFFDWIKLSWDWFSEDLIILCNWLFWKHYFADYDFFWDDFHCLWTKIIWENQIWERIEFISENINFIIQSLKWDELLTNSVKNKISFKIKETFFVLSWIIFLLYSLKEKTENNITELSNYNWLAEYEWESRLLLETSITKKIELETSISLVESKIELFIWTIKKIII